VLVVVRVVIWAGGIPADSLPMTMAVGGQGLVLIALTSEARLECRRDWRKFLAGGMVMSGLVVLRLRFVNDVLCVGINRRGPMAGGSSRAGRKMGNALRTQESWANCGSNIFILGPDKRTGDIRKDRTPYANRSHFFLFF
jgi:hypothetical protein